MSGGLLNYIATKFGEIIRDCGPSARANEQISEPTPCVMAPPSSSAPCVSLNSAHMIEVTRFEYQGRDYRNCCPREIRDEAFWGMAFNAHDSGRFLSGSYRGIRRGATVEQTISLFSHNGLYNGVYGFPAIDSSLISITRFEANGYIYRRARLDPDRSPGMGYWRRKTIRKNAEQDAFMPIPMGAKPDQIIEMFWVAPGLDESLPLRTAYAQDILRAS